jgi:hypothetical protein
MTAGGFSQAIDRLRRLVKAEGTTSEIDALLQQAIDRQVAADREARLQKEITELLADARRRIDEKDWGGAEKRLEKVLALEPANAGARQTREALNTLRESHRREEEARARVEAEARTAALERDIREQAVLARTHIQQRQFKKAIKVIDAARQRLSDLPAPDELTAELDAIVAQARNEQESPAQKSGAALGGTWKAAAAVGVVVVGATAVWFATRTSSNPPSPPNQPPVVTSVATSVPPAPAPAPASAPASVEVPAAPSATCERLTSAASSRECAAGQAGQPGRGGTCGGGRSGGCSRRSGAGEPEQGARQSGHVPDGDRQAQRGSSRPAEPAGVRRGACA